ncbi:Splicing factor 3B subunit 2 [Nowakowskiella sp. JEL0078]|nr:Splicing factor 3B subunit 2 [Nowakowskiella sp. JEL0078]
MANQVTNGKHNAEAEIKTTKPKNVKNKRHKKRAHTKSSLKSDIPLSPADEDIEIIYVPEEIPELSAEFAEFGKIFEHFSNSSESPNVPDVSKDVGESMEIDEEESEADDEDDEVSRKISRKKLRKEKRLTVSELKQVVKKPESVEWVDVCAADPKLLVHLKSYRNTVPVPIHWQQKRKYLQGKRGIEKPPFELPDFIKKTGIMEMRSAVRDKEDQQKLKSKTRERHQPKMGKLDIDYQKLHDAFFRWQTKPKLTLHGDLYYEGKEFETKLKLKKPGQLSEDLKIALSIPLLAPPPWLINMQRYGPPPSYPNLKIPGLNAPIPDGAQWGYHPGGWGKPPVDEYNRPLYGDVFGISVPEIPTEHVAPIERDLWGQLESDEEIEEEVVEEEEEEEEDDENIREDATDSGMVTPSGISSVPSGLETPEFVELRKETRRMVEEEPKQLYQIIPERATTASGSFMGSQHVYDLTAEKSTGKRKAYSGVDVSINPEDLEKGLDEEALQRRFDQQVSAEPKHEDFSDMVAEHANKQAQAKKRRKGEETKGNSGSSKKREFKF